MMRLLPTPLYQAVPAVYAMTGAALVPTFGNSIPIVVSTVMLVAAGCTAMLKRHTHKEEMDMAVRIRSQWAQRRQRRLGSLR